MAVPESTEVTPTAVTTSPAVSPSAAAGVPATAPAISTPAVPVLVPPVPMPVPVLPVLPVLVSAISMPRNAVVPMWMVDEASPASIWSATEIAVLIGIEKPWVALPVLELDDPLSPDAPLLPEDPLSPLPNPPNPPNPPLPFSEPPLPTEVPAEAAVSMPTTAPNWLTSGPPESPGWMSALDSIRPLSCSEVPEPSSDAVIDWLRAVTWPGATDGVPPAPPALPSPTTLLPTLTVLELPMVAVFRPEAPLSWSTAT